MWDRIRWVRLFCATTPHQMAKHLIFQVQQTAETPCGEKEPHPNQIAGPVLLACADPARCGEWTGHRTQVIEQAFSKPAEECKSDPLTPALPLKTHATGRRE